MRKFYLSYFIAMLFLTSCNVLQKTSRTDFNQGYYKMKVSNTKSRVFLAPQDTLLVYFVTKPDTLVYGKSPITNILKPVDAKFVIDKNPTFYKHTFDIDFLTIPLKFRPPQSGVPAQLNTNLNGAVYLGYRTDYFKPNYERSPSGKATWQIQNAGFSLGAFSGFGNTFMSPTNTSFVIEEEYDAVIWTKGIAFIFAVNRFTTGLSVGFDSLMDKNKDVWIYQSKPWFGLAFGLNLN